MQNLVIYALLCTALFYLGARAMITRFLWSRYTPRLAQWADCPACSGTWYGLALSMSVGWYYELDIGPFAAQSWITPLIVAACMMVLVPMVAALMEIGFQTVGSTVGAEEPPA